MEQDNKTNFLKNILLNDFVKDWIYPFLAAFVLFLLVKQFLFFNVKVPTGSMLPTIQLNDRIVVTRIYNFNNIERGEILVFKNKENGKTLIKRLIGLPGDTVLLKEDGSVYINGELLKEDYVKNQIDQSQYERGLYVAAPYGNMNLGEFRVPEGKYFFMGDNRPYSIDARYWKNPYIDKKDIEGRARWVFFPFNRFGKLDS